MPAITATTTIGTLNKNTDPHQKWSNNAPPTSRPNGTLMAAMPAQMPMALARSSRGKTSTMIESVGGMIMAAPRPMIVRDAINCSVFAEYAANTLDMPRTTMPVSMIRFLPKRSANDPMVNNMPASTKM